jgi:hypothetical protein
MCTAANGGGPAPNQGGQNSAASPRFAFHDYEDARTLNVLGQKIPYPKKGMELAALVAVLAFLFGVFSVGCWFNVGGKAKERLLSMFEVEKSGTVRSVKGFSRFGFWTPAADTESVHAELRKEEALTLKAEEKSAFPDLEDWEKGVTEKTLRDFGDRLVTVMRSNGYRRYEVMGKGSSKFKKGWWWVAGLPDSVTPEQFAAFYRETFKTEKVIYLETMGESP